jgi:uncharacterized membrane protein YfcA
VRTHNHDSGTTCIDWQAFANGRNIAALVCASVGVIAGTLFGRRLLKRVPEGAFKRVLGVALIAIGALLLLRR